MPGENERPRLSRRGVVAASAGLVGVVSLGVASATSGSGDQGDASSMSAAVGPMVDLRRFGAVPDGSTDLAPAIARAVQAYAGTCCSLNLAITRPGESYRLQTDAILDQPDISLVGNGAAVEVAPGAALHVGRPDRRTVANARITGVRWYRDGTNNGRAIPEASRFIVLHRVRNLVIESSVFSGADVAIHIPPNPASEMHDTAFIQIVGENYFDEVNYAVKGEYDPSAPAGWTSIGDTFVTGSVVNRSYVTGVHFDGVDGLAVNECDFVNVGSRSLDEPRVADKRHNVYVGQGDWVHVTDNQLYEAGLDAVRVDAVRQAKVTGNLIAWPGQLEPSDGIRLTGFPGFPARAVVSDNVVVYYTRNAVTVSGDFASLALGANAVSYSAKSDRYVGPAVRGSAAPALDSVPHFRYDLGDVAGLTAAQVTVAGSSSQRPGEGDRLPGHPYLLGAQKDTAISGSSAALRDLQVNGPTGVFPLSDVNGATQVYGGTVLVVVKGSFAGDSPATQHLLLLAHPGDECLTLGKTGGPGAPSFTFSVANGTLVATPGGGTSGRFVFSAQATGNLLVG